MNNHHTAIALPSDSVQLDLWELATRSIEECRSALEANISRFQARRTIERDLQQQLNARTEAILPGYCWVCRNVRAFSYDMRYSDGKKVNWRERIVCPTCRLNNRLRLAVQIFERMATDTTPHVYLTEQVTPFAGYMAAHFPNTIASEYLGEQFSAGEVNKRGIRHENVTSLSFGNELFDFILTFDVLEHVPNYRSALAEFHRVLKPTGKILISVPFGLLTDRNIVRARIGADGTVEHLMTPEYHGDPVDPNGGILCYYHFGWELLEELRGAGFTDASVIIAWSLEFGHIGEEQVLIMAHK